MKTTQRAHRMAWRIARGPIPRGMHVLHSCDNPICCNPRHLRLGTNRDNVDDRVERGRQQQGENVPSSRLTAAAVMAMRREAERPNAPTKAALARFYGVSRSCVRRILGRQTWAHLEDTAQ